MGLFSKPHGKHAPGKKSDSAELEESKKSQEEVDEATENASAEENGNAGASEVSQDSSQDASDSSETTSDEKPASDASAEDASAEDDASEKVHDADATQAISKEEEGDSTEQASDSEETVALPVVPLMGTEEGQDGQQAGFVAANFGEIPAKRRKRGLKVAGIALGILVGLVALAYVVGGVLFMGRFLPNTVAGDNDISFKTDDEVTTILQDVAENYRIDIVGDGFSYRAQGKDISLSIDAAAVVKAMHEKQNPWQWPVLIFQQSHDVTDCMTVSYSVETFNNSLNAAISKFNETAKPPVNASIVYNNKTGKFEVKPEEVGTQLNATQVLKSGNQAVSALQNKMALDNEDLLQPTLFSTDAKLKEAADLATGMVSAKLTLVMGGMEVGVVDGNALSQFITIGDNYQVTFKEEEMNAWVSDLAAGFNTVGTERTFTRADGKEVVVPAGGVYGWEVDTEALKQAIIEGIESGSVMQVEVPCEREAKAYSGPNKRDWGNRYIDVDLTEQHVRFYGDDGAIIWEADCISGAPDGTHNTGTGMWYVNNKESPSKLIGYENGKKIYETMVTYWMAFEYSGIGFHDATWQPSFGGTMYANGYGSHGCVNLSYSDAEALYGIVEIGDVVAVHF